MLHPTIDKLNDFLVDVEGADIKVNNSDSKNQQTLYGVGDIQTGRFRRLFNRHHKAYRFFN